MRGVIAAGAAVCLIGLGACTTLKAPEEVKALKEASGTFTSAIAAADQVRVDAIAARNWEVYRRGVIESALTQVVITSSCVEAAKAWNLRLNAAVGARPYDWQNADRTYQEVRGLRACDFERFDVLPSAALPVEASLADPAFAMSADAANLPTAAANLKSYVLALADVATGESAGRVDAARDKLAKSAQGLAKAMSINPLAEPIIGLINTAVGSLIAARRNAATRAFLNEMDRAMPTLMERMGTAGRTAVADAVLNRATAAREVGGYGNRILNPGSSFLVGGRVSADRMRLLDEVADRLATHNEVFRAARTADPMEAARAFAKAHRELTAVFNDPRRNRAALIAGIEQLQDSAAKLDEAIEKARTEGEK